MSSEHKAWAAAFTGTVVDVQRWTERSVTSQPGYTTVTGNMVYHSPGWVNVQEAHRQRLFVRSDKGQEETFQIGNTLAFRPGSKFIAVWGSQKGAQTGDYLYMENEDTGKFYAPAVKRPGGYGPFNGFLIGLIAAGIGFLVATALVQSGALKGVRDGVRNVQLEKQAARIEDRNREWAKNAGTRNYAKYCGAPGERKGKVQFSASGSPVCQLRVPDLGMQLKTTPVRMSGGSWVCQCPSSQETEQYYYESLTTNARELLSAYNPVLRERSGPSDRDVLIMVTLAAGMLGWGIGGTVLAKRRRAERQAAWDHFVDRIENAAANRDLIADTGGLAYEGIRIKRFRPGQAELEERLRKALEGSPVKDRVLAAIVKELEKKEFDVLSWTKISELGGSQAVTRISRALTEEFQIDLDIPDDSSQFTTVKDVIDYVEAKVAIPA